jgi:hypothetical protein
MVADRKVTQIWIVYSLPGVVGLSNIRCEPLKLPLLTELRRCQCSIATMKLLDGTNGLAEVSM